MRERQSENISKQIHYSGFTLNRLSSKISRRSIVNPDELYLGEVDGCSIYLGIFGNEYGSENKQGLSPTELEFERATEKSKYRLIFVKGKDDSKRHPKMQSLINRASPHVVRRRFTDTDSLKTELFAALVQFLRDNKIITSTPFDESPCPGATLRDISGEKVEWFIPVAQKKNEVFRSIREPRSNRC